ncbi:l-lactate dehydrogenase-like protein [Cucurbitaria berberidis CBS 394.84]|uniref:L-lactate dehydrogenase n=1 Tax=Cucurbitaria berberidis CBS 394.84 TaxID=1168544 RepID=A0A9P4L852_9PLEO|nr:l-lactate dehydrogenase-like protein [Cucurbitaria berberidis CBS 394.84]KAF1845691.1 l-lactate dehydrogenase-like protein [Cucurbitaria berberidis CBS 394.84]
MTQPKLKSSIAILGCGDVGSTLAYTLIMQPICSEVIMVDLKKELLEAQVRDLSDSTYGGRSGVKVRAGTHKDAGQADIVVITAGAKQKHGESRLSLLSRNLHILESIFSSMAPISPHTILLLVANPVDILTYFARKLSGLPESQVLGTGTSLDSARLRGILAEKAEVAPSSIDAYVLGEHGDSQFIVWSSATIGTTPLHLALPGKLTPEFKASISAHTRGAAGAIIAAKGCTSYGIGNIAASICKYILFDSRSVRPISFYQPELGCCLSMPAVVGRKGIIKSMPVLLDETERAELEKCASGLRGVIEGAEKELSADEQLRKALEVDEGV